MRALVFAALVLAAHAASAQPRLPLLFSDGAVLQRDQPIPVWGWAEAHADVRVTLGDDSRTARADARGRWRVSFPPRAAGGPLTLTAQAGGAQAGGARALARDLLIGDVWLLSGQSNMEWTVKDAQDAAAEIASAADARIRHFKVPRSSSRQPEERLGGGHWAAASPQTVGDFSAVGYFFARDVRQHHDVPIGLVHASWGGSRIEPWMSPPMLGLDGAGLAETFAEEERREGERLDRLREKIGDLPERDAGMDGDRPLWAAPDLDDSSWSTIRVPGVWEGQGYDDLDGVAWYRTTFTLTASQAREGVTLGLGAIDDDDIAWVNGTEVGRMTNAWNVARRYPVPPGALRAGKNVLAVRVTDHLGGGGIAGAEDLLYVETASQDRRSLVGDWRFRVGEVRAGGGGRDNQIPTLLWNAMIHPVTPFPIAGVLWYQGESNASTPEDAAAYRDLFPAMIQGWRQAWGRDDLPFYWVQLANFMTPPAHAEDTGTWPLLRESQSAALALSRTAEALAIDVGEADDIHPRDKQTVGRRLARAARRDVYGEHGLAVSGPRYRDHTVRGDEVVLAFEHAHGLATRDGAPPAGFALRGADGPWVWADARIDRETVIVWSDAVRQPVAVRYAWANNPDRAALVNGAGLPASPFRAGE